VVVRTECDWWRWVVGMPVNTILRHVGELDW
jgi:hypothetical protein